MTALTHAYTDESWLVTPIGPFRTTAAYILGASYIAAGKPIKNPFPPGPEHAQFSYGYQNERNGYHDDLEDFKYVDV